MGRFVAFVLLGLLPGPPAHSGWTMKQEPPRPPGQSESCRYNPPRPDYTTKCPDCDDVEILRCDIYLGHDQQENKMVFTLLNHNEIYTRSSDSASFGHVGINPVKGDDPNAQKFDANGGAANVGQSVADSPEEFAADYPNYQPANPMSESKPDPLSIGPREVKEFVVHGVTDFPPIAACEDIVFMGVVLRGHLETPYLWNRNYACTVVPCERQDFIQCKVHRGDASKGKASGKKP